MTLTTKWPVFVPDPSRDLPCPADVPGPMSAVLDTDTYNEIDDQFALVYALLSPQRLTLEACYAAPFHNNRSTGPADGMAKSYEEIHRVLERMAWSKPLPVLRGATSYLSAADRPAESDAAADLVQRALAPREGRLHVIAIGAITNIASAILMEPSIVERITVLWLGGHPLEWHDTGEFNLKQDLAAARVVFDSGVPMVHVPCKNVAEHLRVSIPELRELVSESGAVGRYLYDIVAGYHTDHRAWSKVIWDVAPIAAMIDRKWVPTALKHSPILSDRLTWSHDPNRHLIRVATHVNRDAVFRDFADKLAAYTAAP